MADVETVFGDGAAASNTSFQSTSHTLSALPPLSILQYILDVLWDWCLQHESLITHPFFLPGLGLLSYIVFSIPFLILDFVRPSWAMPYKLQPNVQVTMKDIRKCVGLAASNWFWYIFPLASLQFLLPRPDLPKEAPTAFDTCLHVVAYFIVFDIIFYTHHRYMHVNKWLYKKVHSVHHEYSSTYALVTEYIHPVEMFVISANGAIPPYLFFAHPLLHFIWLIIINFTSVEHHCGYEFPINLHRLTFGAYAGARWHDDHHLKPNRNYCGLLSIWDRFLKTSVYDKLIFSKKRQ